MPRQYRGFDAGLARALAAGAVGVMPTDTIYGLTASAFDEAAVERVYETKGRDRSKPLIVLISDMGDLARLSIHPSPAAAAFLEATWPGAVSIILPCPDETLRYLHRGTGTLAVRLPANEALRRFLAESGPLVAPSANPENEPPARTIAEAAGYFGDAVDFYSDLGLLEAPPSTLVSLLGDEPEVKRQGAVRIAKRSG